MIINNNFILKYKSLIIKEIRNFKIVDISTIEDIFNKVIERVLKTHHNYDRSKGAITTWLTYQTRSVVSHYLRDKKHSTDALQHVSMSLDYQNDASTQEYTDDYKDTLVSVLDRCNLSDEKKNIIYNKHQ